MYACTLLCSTTRAPSHDSQSDAAQPAPLRLAWAGVLSTPCNPPRDSAGVKVTVPLAAMPFIWIKHHAWAVKIWRAVKRLSPSIAQLMLHSTDYRCFSLPPTRLRSNSWAEVCICVIHCGALDAMTCTAASCRHTAASLSGRMTSLKPDDPPKQEARW